MHDLAWFRDMGPLTRTRYPNVYVWHVDRGLWRHVMGEGYDWWETGPPYATKMEAMADLATTAERWA